MNPARQRDTGIDTLRALFVFIMVWGHFIMLLGIHTTWSYRNVSWLFAPTGYSGFMFCFGYVAYITYLSKGTVSLRRIFPSVYRPILAFYISGICFDLIISSQPLSFDYLFKVLILWHIPGFSEFLPGFSLTLLVSALLVKPLLWITENPRRTLICGVLLWATTFFPYQLVRIPEIALFVGASDDLGYFFPVLQYFVMFLLGVYFSRHQIGVSRPLAILATVGMLGFFILNQVIPDYITRFPPSPSFILTGIPMVLFFYVMARLANRSMLVRRLAVPIGANSLFYLLLSNIILFGLARGLGHPDIGIVETFFGAIALMIAVGFCTTIVRSVKLELPSEERVSVASASAQRVPET